MTKLVPCSDRKRWVPLVRPIMKSWPYPATNRSGQPSLSLSPIATDPVSGRDSSQGTNVEVPSFRRKKVEVEECRLSTRSGAPSPSRSAHRAGRRSNAVCCVVETKPWPSRFRQISTAKSAVPREPPHRTRSSQPSRSKSVQATGPSRGVRPGDVGMNSPWPWFRKS